MSDLVFVWVYPSLCGGYSLRLAHLSEFESCSSGAVVARSLDHALAVVWDSVANFEVNTMLCSRRVAESIGVDMSTAAEWCGFDPHSAPA